MKKSFDLRVYEAISQIPFGQVTPISRNVEVKYQGSLIRAIPNEKMYNVAHNKLAAITGLAP